MFARIPKTWSVPSPERLNQLTHGCGFALSVCGAWLLISTAISTGGATRIWGCGAFAVTLVLLYAASTLSHSFDDPQRRRFFRMVDQVCIFLLAAGSFTPFALVWAQNWIGRSVLWSMWSIALVGSAYRALRGENSVAIGCFVLMGWLPGLTLGQIYAAAGPWGLFLVLGGAGAYTGGTWFLLRDHRQPYYHSLWHLSTILGSACHVLFCWQYIALPT